MQSTGDLAFIVDGFLPADALEALRNNTFSRAGEFEVSRLGGGRSDPGRVDPQVRRSRVLYHVGAAGDDFVRRARHLLPTALTALGLRPLPIARIQLQATSTNDGEFFRPHRDNRHPESMRRWLSFTFFLHRQPRAFTGGELRIQHDGGDGWSSIEPETNRIVMFPPGVLHEIATVACPSGAFEDSRLTLNGWIVR